MWSRPIKSSLIDLAYCDRNLANHDLFKTCCNVRFVATTAWLRIGLAP